MSRTPRANTAYHQQLRAKRIREKVCQRCGKEPVSQQKTCLPCRKRISAWYYRKKAAA